MRHDMEAKKTSQAQHGGYYVTDTDFLVPRTSPAVVLAPADRNRLVLLPAKLGRFDPNEPLAS
ncbi:hypothetical protein GCM10023156_66200 [Novipirellula rosea]|uniref:Uncharacterized protein n=1 Tax=Novipirellula rosea TaxID=1031540 RepID=A0ABP8NRC5_9BACT